LNDSVKPTPSTQSSSGTRSPGDTLPFVNRLPTARLLPALRRGRTIRLLPALRRAAPLLGLLLAALVLGQSTDLLACADEAQATEHAGEIHADAAFGAGHPIPAPGAFHTGDEHDHEEGGFADCLCHVVFTSTAMLPAVPALGAPERPRAALLPVRLDVAPAPVDHVPLG
jgi:hypothetical protein